MVLGGSSMGAATALYAALSQVIYVGDCSPGVDVDESGVDVCDEVGTDSGSDVTSLMLLRGLQLVAAREGVRPGADEVAHGLGGEGGEEGAAGGGR